MFNELILQSNKSVYKISKESGIPYTTLNELVLGKKELKDCSVKLLSSLASYFGVSMDRLYNGGPNPSHPGESNGAPTPASIKLSDSWNETRKKKYTFNVVATSDFKDISRIHPLKQKEISAIYSALVGDSRVTQIIIFGSSTNVRCGKNSDIDIAVELSPGSISTETKNAVSELVQNACGYDADIIWMDRVEAGSQLQNNIQMGVRLI